MEKNDDFYLFEKFFLSANKNTTWRSKCVD